MYNKVMVISHICLKKGNHFYKLVSIFFKLNNQWVEITTHVKIVKENVKQGIYFLPFYFITIHVHVCDS